MRTRYWNGWRRVMIAGCICLVLGTGCRTRKTRGRTPETGGTEILIPSESIPGDESLSTRFEDGVRVTDVTLENVMFAFDSFQIEPGEVGKIDAVATYMTSNPATRLVVEGHCDERGSNEYNMSLGEHRALAIRANLISLGIGGDRIQTRSFGEERPADSGHNEEAWRINRRGEFALYR